MKNNKKGSGAFKSLLMAGMLATALTFGLVLAGCDDGGGGNGNGSRTKVTKIPAGDTNKITITGLDAYKGKYAYASVFLKAFANADGSFNDGVPLSGDERIYQQLWAVQDAFQWSDSAADYITCGLIDEDGKVELKVYLQTDDENHYRLWKETYTFKTGEAGVGEDFDLYIFNDETVQGTGDPIATRWFHVTAFLGGGEWTGTSNN
ncbi:hypothetical protein AGMMS50267_12960 [Spirochaetia bacterium]|nr:hypothetical protein AGMMS50267_12960 [Spirochaetia bacterium]